MFIPSPSVQAPPISQARLGRYIAEAEQRGRQIAATRGMPREVRLPMADAIAIDYHQGLIEVAGVKQGTPASAMIRDQLRHGLGMRPMADAIWTPQADAASTVPDAGTFVNGAPIAPVLRPLVLRESLASVSLPIWTDTVRFDYYNITGTVAWGRAGDTRTPSADYTVESEFSVTPELVWTSTTMNWRQAQMATSPNYAVNPQALKSDAAMFVLKNAIENALISTPAGTALWSLRTIPCLRATSALVYGTSAWEQNMVDFIKFLQTVPELSLGMFKPTILDVTQRIINCLVRPVTTSTGYPMDAAMVLQQQLAVYGITQVNIVPSLQDFGGTDIDLAQLRTADANGLRQYEAMQPMPIRTVQQGLDDVSYFGAIHGGLHAAYRATTYQYLIEITPAA